MPFHDAGEEVAHPRRVERAEPQRVEHRDRTRAHREDVAQNSADAGRRALIRLDGRRMVVRLDLERDGESVADGDDAGVLARSLQHVRRFGRQRLQHRPRMLVRAVLAPQRADDAELGERRRAAEHGDEPIVLVGREPVLGDERRRDGGIAGSGRDGHGGPGRGGCPGAPPGGGEAGRAGRPPLPPPWGRPGGAGAARGGGGGRGRCALSARRCPRGAWGGGGRFLGAKIASTTLSPCSTTRSFMPQRFAQEFW